MEQRQLQPDNRISGYHAIRLLALSSFPMLQLPHAHPSIDRSNAALASSQLQRKVLCMTEEADLVFSSCVSRQYSDCFSADRSLWLVRMTV